jgi:hypothetical protein
VKTDENLSKIFNIEMEEKKPAPVAVIDTNQSDFDLARSTLRDLISRNDAVIEDLVSLARSSEHPRAYEVAGQLIKTQADIAKDLLGIYKQKKDAEDKASIKTQNNIVFAGSTSDLLKMIASERSAVKDIN